MLGIETSPAATRCCWKMAVRGGQGTGQRQPHNDRERRAKRSSNTHQLLIPNAPVREGALVKQSVGFHHDADVVQPEPTLVNQQPIVTRNAGGRATRARRGTARAVRVKRAQRARLAAGALRKRARGAPCTLQGVGHVDAKPRRAHTFQPVGVQFQGPFRRRAHRRHDIHLDAGPGNSHATKRRGHGHRLQLPANDFQRVVAVVQVRGQRERSEGRND